MSGVVRGLVCAGLIASSGLARAEGAGKAPAAKGPAAVKPPAATPVSAPTPKAAGPSGVSKATPASDAPSTPTAPATADSSSGDSPSAPALTPDPAPPSKAPAHPGVRVYMRSGTEPLAFWVREQNPSSTPSVCAAPCDGRFAPGEYNLRLNGVRVEHSLQLSKPGTLEGKLESHEGSREGGWLALNVGGIIGGVFITVAALGGPSWAYAAGGGSLLGGGVIFALTYRADRATVSFTPGEPIDLRGLPPPVPAEENSSGPTPNARLDRARGGQARGIGFQIAF